MTENEAINFFKDFIETLKINGEEQVLKNDYCKSANIAINALEKQIPKKPKERDCIGFNILVCPVGKRVLYLYEPYCDNCGQAIDWSDAD